MSQIAAGNRSSVMAESRSPAQLGLLAGAIAPPIFVVVVAILGLIQPSYNPVTDYVSEMSRGELGWVQRANFLICGAALLGFAAGIRWGVQRDAGSVGGAALMALIGAGVIVAGIFTIDPHTSTVRTVTGTVHIVAFVVVSIALITACFVFARRFQGGLRAYSVASGILLPITLIATQFLGGPLNISGILQRAFVLVGWAWITVLALSLRFESRRI